jgi:hypothetical protein
MRHILNTYRAAGLAHATPRISAWIGRFAPQLRAVTIRCEGAAAARRFRTAAVVKYAAPPALRSHRDCFAADGSGTLEVLTKLARCPSLERLTLEPLIMCEAMRRLHAQKLTAPFLRLRSLDARIESPAIHLLSKLFPATTRLRLQIVQGLSTFLILRRVTSLSRLRSLTLAGDIRSGVHELLNLRNLSLLVELDLQGVVLYTDDFPRPLDDDVRTLVSGLPLLRVLKLGFGSQLSDSAYILVAQHCRHLEEFRFVADCSVKKLEGSYTASLLFPKLRSLSARDITGYTSIM